MNLSNIFAAENPEQAIVPDLVNSYVEYKTARLAADKVAAALKETENKLKAEVLRRMVDSGQHVLASQTVALNMNRKMKPSPKDWDKIRAYIDEHKAFDLLHKRLTEEAVMARFDAGEPIPGIELFPVDDLTIRTL